MISLQILYALSAALFILGIRGLGSPETARRGMQLAALGMLAAVVGTLTSHHIITYKWIIPGILAGIVAGIPLGLWVPMIAVPQRTAFSHACGALAACLIGIVEYHRQSLTIGSLGMGIIGVEVVLAALTFTGSVVIAGKLQGILPGKPVTWRGQNHFNMGLLTLILMLCLWLTMHPVLQSIFYK